MRVSKYIHDKLNDPNATYSDLEIAHEMAYAAAIDQGRNNPDTNGAVDALAKRINALRPQHLRDEKRAQMWESEATVKRLEASEKRNHLRSTPISLGHIARVGNSMRMETPREIDVVVDTATNLVLTPVDLEHTKVQ